MPFKFEQLEVWKRALDYIELVYAISEQLPREEAYNLISQLRRAATSVALNIAEGSTGQTNAEQARFLGLAIRSLLETVACQHIISRLKLLQDLTQLRQAYKDAEILVAMLHTLRKTIAPDEPWIRDQPVAYSTEGEHNPPF